MNLPADGVSVTVNSQVLMVYRCGDVFRRMKGKGGYWKLVPNTANCTDEYNRVGCNGKQYRRHRIIAYAYLNLDIDDTSKQVDHINGDRICNHVDNLRIVTNQENCHNYTKAKGYYWDKDNAKWRSQIRVNNKQINLGCYNTEEDARAAYLAAKLIYHPSSPIPLEELQSPPSSP
jgi:hypothetical protein